MKRTLFDVNSPKFIKSDQELFENLLDDIFPGVILKIDDYKISKTIISTILE